MDVPSNQQDRHLHIQKLTHTAFNETAQLFNGQQREVLLDGCNTENFPITYEGQFRLRKQLFIILLLDVRSDKRTETFEFPAFISAENTNKEAFKLRAELIACADNSVFDECELGNTCKNRYSNFDSVRKRRDDDQDEVDKQVIEKIIRIQGRVKNNV